MMLLPNFTIAFYMLCPQPTVCAAKACKKARVKLDNNIMKMLLSKGKNQNQKKTDVKTKKPTSKPKKTTGNMYETKRKEAKKNQ